MKVISVNVGQPTALQVGSKTRVTGIRKHPVPGRVQVSEAGLAGDHVLDTRYHGGPDQAVYVYTREDYDAWEELLGRPLEPGTFGENIVIGGVESPEVRVGEQFTLGEVVLEVTAARIPCSTLGARMEDAGFVRRFTKLARPGFYTRVLRCGEVGKGDNVTRQPAPEGAPTIAELFAAETLKERDPAQLRRWLDYPLAVRLRQDIEGWLG